MKFSDYVMFREGSNEDREMNKCDCGKVFRNMKDLTKHMEDCPEADDKHDVISNLTKKSGYGTKLGAGFKMMKANESSHEKTEKEMECKKCGKKFDSKHKMMMHEKMCK